MLRVQMDAVTRKRSLVLAVTDLNLAGSLVKHFGCGGGWGWVWLRTST